MPKGRKTEDGNLGASYPNLKETKTQNYRERTELNVRDSGATLIISTGKLVGGSKLTLEFGQKLKKPILHIDLEATSIDRAVLETRDWLNAVNCEILNIAGPRASEDANIYRKTRTFLLKLFS